MRGPRRLRRGEGAGGVTPLAGTPASSELLHGDKEVVYGDAGYQGIAKRPEMAGTAAEFRVTMRPGKHRGLPDTPEGRLQDLIETALAAGFCLQ